MGTAGSILEGESIFPLPVNIDLHESTKGIDISALKKANQKKKDVDHIHFDHRRRMSMVEAPHDELDSIARYLARANTFKTDGSSKKIRQAPSFKKPAPVFRFKDDERARDVNFIDFDSIKEKGAFPKYSTVGWRVPGELHMRFLTQSADTIDFENSLVVFVSHCWLHSKGDPTPDTPENDQFKLTVAAVQHMWENWAPDMEKCYVWIDYSCTTVQKVSQSMMNMELETSPAPSPQHSTKRATSSDECDEAAAAAAGIAAPANADNAADANNAVIAGKPPLPIAARSILASDSFGAASEKSAAHTWDKETLHLDFIMQCCDCVITPLFDSENNWEPPAELADFFEDCSAAPWQGKPSSYLSRAWCRMEMLYCSNIPLIADLSPDNSRRARLSGQLLNVLNRGQRPHILYGSYQQRAGKPPIMISPLPQSRLDKYHPCSGNLSAQVDKAIINRLFKEIQPYFVQVRVGYTGEVNINGEMHGQGVYRFENGDIYTGGWRNGLQHGRGTMKFADGGYVEGEFNLGIEFGLCTYKYANGDSYYGMLCNYQRVGRGILEFSNGDIYEGFFNLDEFDGEGTMVHNSTGGEIYEGHFKRGQRHGQGVLKSAQGTVIYKGLWRLGEKKQRRKTM